MRRGARWTGELVGVRVWLKNIGASEDPLPVKWYDEGSNEGEFRWFVRFSNAFNGAGIERNDLLVYMAFYAIANGPTQRRIVAVARVSSNEPEQAPRSEEDQWPLLRRVTPLLIVPLAGHGVELGDLDIEAPPMGGYKELKKSQLQGAVRALARNALPGDLATGLAG